MVDAVVSFAVEKLGDALISETYFLLGVGDQVEGLRDELIRMQCFLKDADAKDRQGDERVRNWIKEIRELAYDAEDVIDTYILKVDSTRKTQGIRNFLSRKDFMVRNLGYLHRVGNEIQALQSRLKAISESTSTYGIQKLGDNETNQSMIQHPQRNRYVHVEDDVVGFQKHTETLLTELMKDDEDRRVVSIIGVGGLGKTTLAKKIYRHDKIKRRFDCCGWSSVSQQLNVGDVLGEIMICLSLPKEGNLMANLYNYLKDKRYFIVLDDVWEVGHWTTLKNAFPSGKRGSKVLLTTRNKHVASMADPSSLHLEPLFLNDEESWELFCRNAFPKEIVKASRYPTDLERLGRKMVRKCGGLPLGICVLGGLLATKGLEIKKWELVHRDVNSFEGVNAILALSYHDLPSHLKPCFLYLSLFPEDSAIPVKKLIRLWVSEGFIPDTNGNLMEDIGKHEYLAELSQRCMIQLSKESTFDRFGVTKCRVHDLMRDLCLSKAKEINFSAIYNQQDHTTGDIQTSHPVTTDDACRRVRRYATHLIGNYEETCNMHFRSDCAIRSLLIVLPRFGHGPVPINFQNIKLLRVLDVQNVIGHKTNITKQVSKLIHLRYLDLGNLRGCSVSSSIGNLRNLQTLKFFSGKLPETASKLVELRHLMIFQGSVDEKFRIENLSNLQTIDDLSPGKWIRKGCFEKLSNLRRLMSLVDTLYLYQTEIIVEEVVRKRYSQSSPIRSLGIRTHGGFPTSIFDSLSCCHNLHTLDLDGRLDVPNLHKYPENLTKLKLRSSKLKEDPMAALQNLPKLRNLDLGCDSYVGEEMVCSSQGFPQLETLFMYDFPNLKEWRVEQGGMPRLKVLQIRFFRKLSMLPEGLRFITTLEKLEISHMPLFKRRIVQGGEDRYKVQHIRSITADGKPV